LGSVSQTRNSFVELRKIEGKINKQIIDARIIEEPFYGPILSIKNSKT
jgi:hypothetical protein